MIANAFRASTGIAWCFAKALLRRATSELRVSGLQSSPKAWPPAMKKIACFVGKVLESRLVELPRREPLAEREIALLNLLPRRFCVDTEQVEGVLFAISQIGLHELVTKRLDILAPSSFFRPLAQLW